MTFEIIKHGQILAHIAERHLSAPMRIELMRLGYTLHRSNRNQTLTGAV